MTPVAHGGLKRLNYETRTLTRYEYSGSGTGISKSHEFPAGTRHRVPYS